VDTSSPEYLKCQAPGSVLVAEDDPLFRRLVESWLRKWNFNVTLTHNGAEAWQALQQPDSPRLLVLDWMMPQMDGVELCRKIRGANFARSPYIILLTANDQTEQIVYGLNAGADDYLTKPINPNELQARLQVGMRTLSLQAALCAKEEQLRFAATHDGLTGIWNRGALMEFLQRELAQSKRTDTPLSLMMIDVDHFKQVNDKYGHLAGDAVLREIAVRLQGCCRNIDWVGRFGGEEFMVLASNCGVDGLPRFSERLRTAVSDLAVKTCSGSVSTSVSIGGVVVDPRIQSSCDTLIQVADMALYCAKHGGRNRCVLLQADGGPYPDSNSTAQMPAPPDLASASPASIA